MPLDEYPDPSPLGEGANASAPGAVDKKRPPVSPLTKQPTIELIGLPGTETVPGTLRLYFDNELSEYVDIPDWENAVLAWKQVDADTGLVKLFLKASAAVDAGHVVRNVGASFLKGGIASKHLAAGSTNIQPSGGTLAISPVCTMGTICGPPQAQPPGGVTLGLTCITFFAGVCGPPPQAQPPAGTFGVACSVGVICGPPQAQPPGGTFGLACSVGVICGPPR